MPLKIVRNDITKMNTDAIVNTASAYVTIGDGCDRAVYTAAGEELLLDYRRKNIGSANEGEAFITPGFNLAAKYIIHAVSPLYRGGQAGEEELLRACYQNSLKLAKEKDIATLAFPLIAAGSFGYPKEEAMRIAVDEISAFLMGNDMLIYLVVFDDKATNLGKRLYPGLEAYIDQNYVDAAVHSEYSMPLAKARKLFSGSPLKKSFASKPEPAQEANLEATVEATVNKDAVFFDFEEQHESKLKERMKHMSDTYSEYLMYLIQQRNMENAEVYKRAIVDKKIFSKIKNNVNYHPNKLTALCLCIGAKLNLDETRDLLARAGYALSPCDKTDIIFSYFIENEIYDMIELDIQLEEHGLPCIIE